MHLYANHRRQVNLARKSFFPAKLNAFPVSSLETSRRLFLRASERFFGMRHERNRIAGADFTVFPFRVSPMKSTVFPRTRVYLFATRSTFDPLKRDPYGTKRQRLASPFDLRGLTAVGGFSVRRGIDVPGDFTGSGQQEPRPCGIRLFYDSAK